MLVKTLPSFADSYNQNNIREIKNGKYMEEIIAFSSRLEIKWKVKLSVKRLRYHICSHLFSLRVDLN